MTRQLRKLIEEVSIEFTVSRMLERLFDIGRNMVLKKFIYILLGMHWRIT